MVGRQSASSWLRPPTMTTIRSYPATPITPGLLSGKSLSDVFIPWLILGYGPLERASWGLSCFLNGLWLSHIVELSLSYVNPKLYQLILYQFISYITPVSYLSQQHYYCTNCQRFRYDINKKLSGVALSKQNMRNNFGSNTAWWRGFKQCHQLPNCYQFLPKKASQREALYHWVFLQVRRHPPSILLCNQEVWVRYIPKAVAGCRKTFSSWSMRDLTPLSAEQRMTNDWPMTDQYCTISYQFFWLESRFWSYFIINLSYSYLFIDFMKFYQVSIHLIMFFICFQMLLQ